MSLEWFHRFKHTGIDPLNLRAEEKLLLNQLQKGGYLFCKENGEIVLCAFHLLWGLDVCLCGTQRL